ncbi:MAG: adenylyl-sulfate kinase [Nitrosomonadales bacterium]|nr:adenylyl-sulfate kinase [Nitrosomonadales bacterium]
MPVTSSNITWVEGKIAPEERVRLLRQEAATIWLTGLSGSGKSTLAFEIEKQLIMHGHVAYALDGDNMRHGLNRDLGFSPRDRTENIRRIAEVARLFNNAGVFVVTAFISPYRADRAAARDIIGADRFIETHLAAGMEICERRDPKGLYKKARAGEISDFTGVSAPYEAPENPSLAIDTGLLGVEESVTAILRAVRPRFRGI